MNLLYIWNAPIRRHKRPVWSLATIALAAVLELLDDCGSKRLQALDEHDDCQYRREHDVGPEALISVPYRQVAQSSPADDSRHGRIANQAYHRQGQTGNEGRQGLRYKNREQDAALAGAARECRVNDATIDFRQR